VGRRVRAAETKPRARTPGSARLPGARPYSPKCLEGRRSRKSAFFRGSLGTLDNMAALTPPSDARSQRERMLAGDLYIADDPELAQDYQRAMALMERFNGSSAADLDLRRRLLDDLLGGFGEGSEIRPPLYCDYGYQIHIGARTFANFGLVALDVAKIVIGDDVQFGPNVQLLTPTHPTDAKLRRAKWEAAKPITIGDNAWLGGGAIVLAGVSIGENAIVGAGAVVTKDVPPNSLVVGNPARVVSSL
jgi:maltose O-acetyltransferase